MKSRLVGEGSTEGGSVVFPLCSDPLGLRSGNGEALMSPTSPRGHGNLHQLSPPFLVSLGLLLKDVHSLSPSPLGIWWCLLSVLL